MHVIDETIERGSTIRVIGVGEFGLKTVGKMVGRINKVECLGVTLNTVTVPDNLPLISLRCSTKEGHQDLAPLLDVLCDVDLVFVVSNPAEEEILLKDICSAIRDKGISVILVIPESACKSDRTSDSSRQKTDTMVDLDGVMIISESSMEPPYPDSWNEQNANTLQEHLFLQAIRQVSDLIITNGMVAIDYTDVTHKIFGGLIQFGAGIAGGDDRAVKAAEKATKCLRQQGIELQNITRAVNSIYASSALMSMNDYNSANTFIRAQFNDECIQILGAIHDESLGDYFMVGIIAVHTPTVEALFPKWVRLYDKYGYSRPNNPTVRDPFASTCFIEDDLEALPWKQK